MFLIFVFRVYHPVFAHIEGPTDIQNIQFDYINKFVCNLAYTLILYCDINFLMAIDDAQWLASAPKIAIPKGCSRCLKYFPNRKCVEYGLHQQWFDWSFRSFVFFWHFLWNYVKLGVYHYIQLCGIQYLLIKTHINTASSSCVYAAAWPSESNLTQTLNNIIDNTFNQSRRRPTKTPPLAKWEREQVEKKRNIYIIYI